MVKALETDPGFVTGCAGWVSLSTSLSLPHPYYHRARCCGEGTKHCTQEVPHRVPGTQGGLGRPWLNPAPRGVLKKRQRPTAPSCAVLAPTSEAPG